MIEVKKGDIIMFISDLGEFPTQLNTARVTRVAKDKSWVDISSIWGRKRVPNTDYNFKVIDWENRFDKIV
ncbi:hypothetical protein G4Z05_00545 [Bacillus thermocopriae]|uniref:Uncharacterized protein n=1 Tax=Neobacillus thermocopriae TaxID=1215031 RepID=A0A6B3TM47_9BACI|nr:hypothetical protein [Neobacillus thermocopriae]NEX77389.1 hypothetical protein [Neobacillus thermocopriae]